MSLNPIRNAGDGLETGGTKGGHGGYVSGVTDLVKGAEFYIYVGGYEEQVNGSCDRISYAFNNARWKSSGYHFTCASGGGATDIRLIISNNSYSPFDFDSLRSRIIVAGAGGGDYYSQASAVQFDGAYSGDAGGLAGYAGFGYDHRYTDHVAGPGSQVAGGSFGYASGGTTTPGNGYFSGKGSNGASSSGGSSYISGHNGCVAITADSTDDNIKQRADSNGQTCTDGTTDITCSYHYSGYKFTNTVMIDGAGYNWTTVKGDYVGQPQPDGTVTTGHTGNGYARITYLGE